MDQSTSHLLWLWNQNLYFIFVTFLTLCDCMHVCAFVNEHAYVCTGIWSPKLMSRIILNCSSTLFIEAGSLSQTQSSPIWLVLLTNHVALGGGGPLSLTGWNYRWVNTPIQHFIFHGSWASKLRSSPVHGRYSNHQVISLAPSLFLFGRRISHWGSLLVQLGWVTTASRCFCFCLPSIGFTNLYQPACPGISEALESNLGSC